MSGERQPESVPGTVSGLLLRWRELRQQGRACSAEELCAGRPELAAELGQRIEAVGAMERRLADLAASRRPGDEPTAVGPAAAGPLPAVDPFALPGYEL